MWLTGFDAPSLHTLYVDKLMRRNGLMQAIARVNRVFGAKSGSLVVDYLGLAAAVEAGARHLYREQRSRAHCFEPEDEAVALMLEKYEVCRDLFHGFDWSELVLQCGAGYQAGDAGRLRRDDVCDERGGRQISTAQGRDRAVQGICAGRAARGKRGSKIYDDVAFFQVVRGAMAKWVRTRGGLPGVGIDQAIRQLAPEVIAAEG